MIKEKISNKDATSFIRDLPKVELHLHLEGAIPIPAMLELCKKYGANVTETELHDRFQFSDFNHFIQTWYWKNQFIKEYDDFEYIASAVAEDLSNQNIKYAEVYFSPADVGKSGLEPQPIAEAIRSGLNKHISNITINLIADLVRDFGAKKGEIILDKIAEVRNQGIVGIGIGGSEHEFPAKLFKKVYQKARNFGFKTTTHAGEVAGSDSIWQAIKDLETDRIGHGTTAKNDAELVDYLINNQIPVEMCPISNVRTKVINDLSEHPIIDFYRRGMIVSVNTDDPKMFNTTLEKEYTSLVDTFNLGLIDIYNLAQNSIKSAWCSENSKNELNTELTKYYEKHVNLSQVIEKN